MYLNIAVFQGSHNVIEQSLVIDRVDLEQRMSWAQRIVYSDIGLLQFCQVWT